jgi:AraC-like DNA-binding protein
MPPDGLIPLQRISEDDQRRAEQMKSADFYSASLRQTSGTGMAISYSGLYFAEPSPAARRLLWHVLSVGTVTRNEPERHEGFDKSGWFLFRVLTGSGTLQLVDRKFQLSPGPRFWLLDLRQPRAYLPHHQQSLTTSGIRFSGIGMEAWGELLGPECEFAIRQKSDWGLAVRSHRAIERLVNRRAADYEWRVHQSLSEILGILLRERGTLAGATSVPSEPVSRVIRAVQAEPTRDWQARELCQIAGVSYSTLRALFQAVQHETVHEFLQRTRLDQARQLLCGSRLSIKQVAQRLHFSSPVYFSQFFRNATGMTPGEFRRSGWL